MGRRYSKAKVLTMAKTRLEEQYSRTYIVAIHDVQMIPKIDSS